MMVLAMTRRRYGTQAIMAVAALDSLAQERRAKAAKVREGELAILKAASSYVITTLAPRLEGRRTGPRRPKSKAAPAPSASSSAAAAKRPASTTAPEAEDGE